MEIRPSHGVHHAKGVQNQGPTRELLAGKLVVAETVSSLFIDTIPNNDKAAKMDRKWAHKATKKMGSGAHGTVMSATRFFNSKTNPFVTLVAPRLRSS